MSKKNQNEAVAQNTSGIGETKTVYGNKQSIRHNASQKFNFPVEIDQVMAGLSRFHLQCMKDSFEGKHIQIKEMGVDLRVVGALPTAGSQGAVEVTPTLTMDNSSEGGKLDQLESGVDVTVIARASGSGNFLVGNHDGLSGSTTIEGLPVNSRVGGALGGFYSRFQGEDRELEKVRASSSVTVAGDAARLQLSGESEIIDKHPSTLSDKDVDIAYLSDSMAESEIEIGFQTNVHSGNRFQVPNGESFSEVYAMVTDFNIYFAKGEHREVWYIKVEVDAHPTIDGTSWEIDAEFDFVGGDNQAGQMDSNSTVDYMWVGIKK